ncbi:NADP-dependent oxidoreductase [Photobacterium profundum]|uniref:NADP-dependent oxidoreductase n=1 Tax=Photobacterium profundum TaxID=74109 RepID=UPI003D097458
MKAARIHDYGSPEVLAIEEVAMPSITADEVLVKVIATSINPLDWLLRSGELKELIPISFPHTLGWDFAGIVEQVGVDAAEYSVGDAVYSRPEVSRNGSHAEYIAVPAKDIALKPRTASFAAAASLPIASITAWQALFDKGELKSGQRVLIHGGAGSLGTIAVQLAKSQGAYVITTAAAIDHGFVKSLGADEVIDFRSINFKDVVNNVDVVLDTIGRQVQIDSYSVLKENGILVAVNTYPDFELARSYGVQARFLSIKPDGEHLKKIAKLVDNGQLRPIVGHEYAFQNIKQAYKLSENGLARGKIVLHVSVP